MSIDDTTTRVAEVLIEHTRVTIMRCHCGWADLGRSHAEHVARALADAGLLATEERDREVAARAIRDASERLDLSEDLFGSDLRNAESAAEVWLLQYADLVEEGLVGDPNPYRAGGE